MDKKLFTPGPLTTSKTVKEAMLRDLGSRDFEFIETVKYIRTELLKIAGVSRLDGFESIIMQGSGTFGIEAVISSIIPSGGHLLVLVNGAYGDRIAKIAVIHSISVSFIRTEENTFPNPSQLDDMLCSDPTITHVASVHCETTTGILNPIEEYANVCNKYNKTFIVDAMSSFGAIPIDMKANKIDVLISSSNKCIEGAPGFSVIIIKRDILETIENKPRTLSLDLCAQWKGLEADGQFRFTPPTHILLAFKQALIELSDEGGVAGRAERYSDNHKTLSKGMISLGFKEYVDKLNQSYIITSFLYPDHPNFDFAKFYSLLNERDCVIYPGKLSKQNCFRIGNIGRIYKEDIKNLLENIKIVLEEMNVSLSIRFPKNNSNTLLGGISSFILNL